MTYRDAIAELVTEHRPEIESDLAEARLVRDQAESAFIDANREVSTLEAIMAMGSPAALPPSDMSERTTLHEAMRKVLQAHSVLRYAQWRQVISDYVATRLGLAADDLLPQVAGQLSLALALTAYHA